MIRLGTRARGWRSAFALVLAYLLVLQTFIGSFTYPQIDLASGQISYSAIFCGDATDNSGLDQQGQAVDRVAHCILCVMGKVVESHDSVIRTLLVALTPVLTVATIVTPTELTRLRPEGGWVSSWSSRAPPFNT